ncbi:MAG TPA: 4-hydroxy-3-methylbut-2-en-1-yl diphosphate synthase, partial [Gammaproteobacteria bacterium]|nr:4-hydroxy-3-methylbut-2-en-1-yl diphosphate synthase [Gammaproteobacteria bacterium]
NNLIFREGKPSHKVDNSDLIAELEKVIRAKAEEVDAEGGETPVKITLGA